VRRYVYHDVVRLGDLEKLIDCSYIQVIINLEDNPAIFRLKKRRERL
jgi:hypothetical protein